MPKTFVDQLADALGSAVRERLMAIVSHAQREATQQPNRKAAGIGKPARRKIDMRCRYPGCKNRSKGPRFRFLCEAHLKLPKKQQLAALEKWNAKKAA